MSEMSEMSELSGMQKAAMVVLFLEEKLATEVLASLDDRELRLLAEAVEELDPIPHQALPGILTEFEKSLKQPVVMGTGTSYMRRLAEGAVGTDRARLLFSGKELPADHGIFGALRSARPEALAEQLAAEHPQVATLVLTRLSAERASAVLEYFDEDVQTDLVSRLAGLEEVPDEVIAAASESISNALAESGAGSDGDANSEFGGAEFAASLLNSMAPEDAERLLASLDGVDGLEDVAARVREAMFTFEDLGRLDNRALQGLLREVPTDDLAIALRSANESLREVFFGAISSRAAATLREDIEFMPPKRLSEVEAAQRSIVEIAMQLASEGKLDLPGGGGAEEMV